ncbi:MAG: hypothetical protein JWN03_1737 [Nocardia sp.]|uniref:DUF6879 family protein n=1 Tax=Nocardia sp. TaxID=1821 RepID=UPI0026051667|nr:DUF6879 family protein [Nocardia sp.]MCU1641462.1 hypothetical protein [Nocardia sp.]
MLHLIDDNFTSLFRTCQRSAFHLEVQDAYETPEESEPFRKFLNGETDDFSWLQGWFDLVRQSTDRGVAFTRVRVITEPHVDYVRWSLAVSPLNIEAGEDIRYLSRHLVNADELAADDYWLFDDTTVAYTMFSSDGATAGAAVTTDPVLVKRCVEIRNAVWRQAIPYADYRRTTVTA